MNAERRNNDRRLIDRDLAIARRVDGHDLAICAGHIDGHTKTPARHAPRAWIGVETGAGDKCALDSRSPGLAGAHQEHDPCEHSDALTHDSSLFLVGGAYHR